MLATLAYCFTWPCASSHPFLNALMSMSVCDLLMCCRAHHLQQTPPPLLSSPSTTSPFPVHLYASNSSALPETPLSQVYIHSTILPILLQPYHMQLTLLSLHTSLPHQPPNHLIPPIPYSLPSSLYLHLT